MRKRVLSILMSVTLVGSMVLAGCGEKKDAATGNSASSSASSASSGASSASSDASSASSGASSSSSGSSSSADKKDMSDIKVAFILPGEYNDGSFNQKGYDAMLYCQENLGVEATYVDRIDTSLQSETLYDYAEQDYDIIVSWGAQMEDDVVDTLAEEFPDTQFVIASGTKANETNVVNIQISGKHLGYGYGYMSAMKSKANKVAFIGAGQGSQAYTDEVGGFIDGAKAYNEDCEVTIMYLNSFNDIDECAQAAELCAEQGCDVMFADVSGAYKGLFDVVTKSEGKILTFGRNADHTKEYPEGCLSYIENDWGIKMADVITNYAENGKWGENVFCGFGSIVSGWTYNFDGEPGWNPALVSEEEVADFQKNVIDMIANGGWDPTFTTEDANPGTY